MKGKVWWCAGAAALLTACGSQPPRPGEAPGASTPAAQQPTSPRPGGYYLDDGPGSDPPPNLDEIADAVPQREPLHRGTARPYTVLGRNYAPMSELRPYKARGTASWYGRKFHGQRTSNGEVYDMYGMTAAHPVLPIPSYVRVTNLSNGKTVVVRVNDRGPFLHGRLIDLSYAAAHKLGFAQSGSAPVEVELILPGDDKLAHNGIARAREPPSPPSSGNPEGQDAIAEILVARDAPAADVAAALSSPKLFLQLGAFSSGDNAENLRQQLAGQVADLAEKLHVHAKDGMYRLQLGPYQDVQEALSIARRLGDMLQLRPVVIQR